MNKVLLLALGSIVTMSAQAESFCGYKDYFHLSSRSHPNIYFATAYSDSDVILQIVGPRSFVIRDTYACRMGYAHVTVTYDLAHWCVLDIKDGPYMMHPTISASCSGMNYLGLTYDGFNTYSYSIEVD
jgi:hypothetical protein